LPTYVTVRILIN